MSSRTSPASIKRPKAISKRIVSAIGVQRYHSYFNWSFLSSAIEEDKTQTTQKQEKKYEVKPQYEELSKQLIMPGIDQLALHSVQLGYLKILQMGNTDPNNTKAGKEIRGQASVRRAIKTTNHAT
ncbi:hypothetical protein F511_25873 [Dorcoceras hygrometricum]|uniref:Uncharacterized protein n=1 Tax=Dorcoceras hygrometricum TaxID=472368 RepID=A0A2Z7A5F5_9LAMI|nr:hypothetical protein F511_25873 [Dorcoceras hygrometricum]